MVGPRLLGRQAEFRMDKKTQIGLRTDARVPEFKRLEENWVGYANQLLGEEGLFVRDLRSWIHGRNHGHWLRELLQDSWKSFTTNNEESSAQS